MAVIELSGTQYLVEVGDVLKVNNLNLEVGKKLDLDKALLTVSGEEVKVGQPYVSGAKVELEVLENLKGPKLEIYKYKAKSRYRRHTGYRSQLTKVRVVKINL